MTQVCERGSSPGAHLYEGIWWDNPMFGFHLCIFQFRESSKSGLWGASSLICVPFQRFQATCSALSTLVRIFFPMYFPRWWSLMIVTALLVSSTTYLKVNGLNDLAQYYFLFTACAVRICDRVKVVNYSDSSQVASILASILFLVQSRLEAPVTCQWSETSDIAQASTEARRRQWILEIFFQLRLLYATRAAYRFENSSRRCKPWKTSSPWWPTCGRVSWVCS